MLGLVLVVFYRGGLVCVRFFLFENGIIISSFPYYLGSEGSLGFQTMAGYNFSTSVTMQAMTCQRDGAWYIQSEKDVTD